jgi:hypothetical protein
MNPEERDQFADQLLNRTLGRYSAAEPAPGLEERLLAKLASAAPKPKPVVQRWAWMAAAAAMLLATVAVTTLWHRPDAKPVSQLPGTSAAPATLNQESAPTPRIAAVAVDSSIPPHRPAVAMRVAAPHLEQFPTPAPLSEQDRLLVSYVNRTPQPELLATNARLAAERDADLKRFFADADPANPAGDAQ